MEFQAVIAFVGLMLVENCGSNGVRYFGTFLGIAGCAGNVPASLAYQANTQRKFCCRSIAPSMRGLPNITAEIDAECFSVASGLQVCLGAIGGVTTANMFL